MKSFVIGLAVVVSFAIGGSAMILGSVVQAHHTMNHLVLVRSR